MTLRIESDEDRAAFMDPDEFGEHVSYRQGGLDVTSFYGLFEQTSATAAGEYGGAILHRVTQLTCRTQDLPTDAADGDTLTVRDHAYTVRTVEPDGTGLSVLRLEQAP
jgi:hypothetical protein